jgi:pyruvate/2-oxoglutarate dehydrogenase complex dihydrolipoamide dehydrogenase (E3) component
MSVGFIERKLFGGTCVNTGCTPTKTLVASAYAAHLARHATQYGVSTAGEVAVHMRAVKAHKDVAVTRARKGVESWLEGMERCTVYRGHARFLSPHEIQVGNDRIAAKQIFINVGGRAVVPNLTGIDRVATLTNTSILELNALAAASGRDRRQLYRPRVRADVPPLWRRGHRRGDGATADRT